MFGEILDASDCFALEKLDVAYIKAANALTDYREDAGFLPGARVEANSQDGMKKRGAIAGFGGAWSSVDHRSVLVILDAGYHQPWPMKNLRLIDKQNTPDEEPAGLPPSPCSK